MVAKLYWNRTTEFIVPTAVQPCRIAWIVVKLRIEVGNYVMVVEKKHNNCLKENLRVTYETNRILRILFRKYSIGHETVLVPFTGVRLYVPIKSLMCCFPSQIWNEWDCLWILCTCRWSFYVLGIPWYVLNIVIC